MRGKTSKPGKRRLAALLLGLCVTTLCVAVFGRYRQTLLVLYLKAELANVPDDRVGEVLRKLADLGEPGLDALTDALSSPRAVVGNMAYETLSDELNACARLEPLDAHDRLRVLAAALAAHVDQQPPTARGAAARLAVRVLLWPADSAPGDRSPMVADCEHVLQAAGAPPKNSPKPRQATSRPAQRQSAARTAAEPRRLDAESRANLPDTTIPPADFELPELARAATDNRTVSGDAAEPGRFDATGTAAMPGQASAAAPAEERKAPAETEAALVSPTTHELRGPARRLKTLDSLALFKQLHESDDAATEAAAELQARGFSIRQIEVGMHLSSPDAHERRLWTEALPGICGVSAKAWLLHLSRDENLGVRRAAVSLLATSGDPEMLRRVGEVARQDSDPDLRLEAARALEAIDQPGADLRVAQ
ncbi:MAG TPA: HEAT repeat domain-containing protein [Pirellulales bacterium]|nr:HEAT repeat domain-containing protein [Pirellulales bacterium]